MKKGFIVLGVFSLVLILAGMHGEGPVKGERTGPPAQLPGGSPAGLSSSLKIDTDFGRMPVYFIPNQGQLDDQVAYYIQGQDKTIYFTEEGITLALAKPGNKKEASDSSERWVVKLDFVGANRDVKPIGEAETGAVVSYFKGKPEEWKTGLATYSKIVYRDLWPGIDLAYYGTVNRLKYELIVHPGADPSRIRLAYRGAESVSVDAEGRLQVTTPAGGFSDDVPLAYQEARGDRVGVPLAYKLGAADEMNEHDDLNRAIDDSAKEDPGKSAQFYGFEVGAYDHAQTLVLDPAILAYCGYIGGSGGDEGRGIAVDGSGNVYVTGITNSTETSFPVAAGPDLTQNGSYDAFVAKVNTSGTGLVYCGYIGGSGSDYGNGIAVDGSGNAYVTGYTFSTEATFPVAVGPDLVSNGIDDAFVAKINAAGTGLVYCGYIGGSGYDYGYGIAVDGSGNAYVTGFTSSTEATFPVAVGPDLTFNGSYDSYVAKVSPFGTSLIYSGYIGGSGVEVGLAIALDGYGNACVTGYAYSTEATFPVAVGPDLTYNSGGDAFVAKINYLEQPIQKHAVGDFDGDGSDEFAIDFGAGGVYMWNAGVWSQLTTNDPENMVPFDIDGNGDKEIAADLGSMGLWMWNGGVWSQLSVNNAEYLIAADTNDNGIEELIIDFGAAGLRWRQESGYMFGMTPFDPQNIIALDVDNNGTHEVVADFGPVGMWIWEAAGTTWHLMTAADPNTIAAVDAFGFGNEGVASGLGPLGIWLWDSDLWGQLSGVFSDRLISGRMMLGGGEEIAGDFGLLGLWLWSSSVWTQLSGVNADDMIAADVDANGIDEVVGDFALTGLWLWNSGAWSQLSGVNSEGILAGNVDGVGGQELIVDFGALGVWMWNAGTWSQISALNPD